MPRVGSACASESIKAAWTILADVKATASPVARAGAGGDQPDVAKGDVVTADQVRHAEDDVRREPVVVPAAEAQHQGACSDVAVALAQAHPPNVAASRRVRRRPEVPVLVIRPAAAASRASCATRPSPPRCTPGPTTMLTSSTGSNSSLRSPMDQSSVSNASAHCSGVMPASTAAAAMSAGWKVSGFHSAPALRCSSVGGPQLDPPPARFERVAGLGDGLGT